MEIRHFTRVRCKLMPANASHAQEENQKESPQEQNRMTHPCALCSLVEYWTNLSRWDQIFCDCWHHWSVWHCWRFHGRWGKITPRDPASPHGIRTALGTPRTHPRHFRGSERLPWKGTSRWVLHLRAARIDLPSGSFKKGL